jgi:protein TonB
VKDKINGEWSYPQSAGSQGVGGMLVVEFVIVKDGSLKSLAVLRSSGHAILDEAALCAIRGAAPFHRFPPKIRAKRLRIRAEFNYIVNSFVRDAGDFIRKVLP